MQPFASAPVSNIQPYTNSGPQAATQLLEPAITGLPNGKLLLAMRTSDFVIMSIGTNSGGTWAWRDPWGSGNTMGICDGQANRPLIPNFSSPPALTASAQRVYLIAADYSQPGNENNRSAANVWESPDGITWTPSALGPLFRGNDAAYGSATIANNRLLF